MQVQITGRKSSFHRRSSSESGSTWRHIRRSSQEKFTKTLILWTLTTDFSETILRNFKITRDVGQPMSLFFRDLIPLSTISFLFSFISNRSEAKLKRFNNQEFSKRKLQSGYGFLKIIIFINSCHSKDLQILKL